MQPTCRGPSYRHHAAVLELIDVCKTFYDPGRGPVSAVDHVSLSIESGVLAIIGANGAGKSTLLRLICTLMQADQGKIVVNNLDMHEHAEKIRHLIGFLSPGTRLYPKISGRELLHYAGQFYDMSPSYVNQRIKTLVKQLRLHDIIDQRCEGLSTGQAQRINIARCMIADPPLLVLDEPTTGLDIEAASELVEMVQLMNDGKRLIIMSTHIVSEIEELADRVVVLHDGAVICDCPQVELGSGMELKKRIRNFINGKKEHEPATTKSSTTVESTTEAEPQ